MSDAGLLETIELIYSAALDPTAWSAVLARLAAMTGCIAGGITIEDPLRGTGRPLTFFGFDPDHVQHCFDHFLPMNPLFRIERRMQPGFIVTNGMVVEPPVFRKSEFYDGWARPQGLCSPVSLVLHRRAGRYMPLTLVRPDGAGEASSDDIALLQQLSPHLIRGMDISLTMERLDSFQGALEDCLERMPVGVVLLDAQDRVLRANHAAELHMRQGAIDVRHGGIRSDRATVEAMVQRALAARRHAADVAIDDVWVERAGQTPLAIRVVPVGVAEPAFDDERIRTMLIIRAETERGETATLGGFAAAHGLTAREQALLELLAVEGLSPAESAGRLGIGLPTVRTHLQRIFDKTHTKRQPELLAKVFRSLLP